MSRVHSYKRTGVIHSLPWQCFRLLPSNVHSATAVTNLKRSATRGLLEANLARRAHATGDHAGAPNVFSPLYVMSGGVIRRTISHPQHRS